MSNESQTRSETTEEKWLQSNAMISKEAKWAEE